MAGVSGGNAIRHDIHKCTAERKRPVCEQEGAHFVEDRAEVVHNERIQAARW